MSEKINLSAVALSAALGIAAAGCTCGGACDARGAERSPHVFAKIADAAAVEPLHPRFKAAFAFLRRPDLAQLPCGRYEIDGTNCWAMISDTNLTPFADENTYEVHRAYIDIQSPITGDETIGILRPPAGVFADFNVEKDYVLFKAKGEARTLAPGEFAVFFPNEGAHAPGHSADVARPLRKLVIKVLD